MLIMFRRLVAILRLPIGVARRFRDERCLQTAASLSFSTLLGLVPLVAMGALLFAHMPFAVDMAAAMEKFLLANLLPEKAGKIIARYIEHFVRKTERLTLIGGAILALTALMQMLTIEHAFNSIWRVKTVRPVLRRLGMHLLTLFLGPILFGGGLVGIGYLAGVSFGLVNEPSWLNALFFRTFPLLVMSLLFALLYHAVPNRHVSRWHALVGGVFATVGFALMQYLFSTYVAHFPTYTVVYGAFAVIPIFLLWLHLSWSVVLIGALIVAELPGVTSVTQASTTATRKQRSARQSR